MKPLQISDLPQEEDEIVNTGDWGHHHHHSSFQQAQPHETASLTQVYE